MILTHESGSQEDQFDEKNGGKKSRETIPLRLPNVGGSVVWRKIVQEDKKKTL